MLLAKRCAVPRGGKPLPVAWDRRKVIVDTIDAIEVLRKENRSPAIIRQRGNAKNSQGQRDKVHGKAARRERERSRRVFVLHHLTEVHRTTRAKGKLVAQTRLLRVHLREPDNIMAAGRCTGRH